MCSGDIAIDGRVYMQRIRSGVSFTYTERDGSLALDTGEEGPIGVIL